MPSACLPLEGEEGPPQPWTETDAVFRERMVEEGNWPAFLLERAAYRFRGLPRMWAHKFSQQHFPPPGLSLKSMKTAHPATECGLGSHGVTEVKMRDAVTEQLGLDGSARASEFEGRTCSFTTAMEWVAESLGIKVVRQDAPSKLAWSVFRWADSHPSRETKFYELYLSRRYKPEKGDDDYQDVTDGLSIGGEDVGLRVSGQSVVPDALPADSDRPEREQGLAEEDELAGFTIGKRAETGS